MDSLHVTDAQSSAVAIAPRVALSDIQSAIATVNYQTADAAFGVDHAPFKTMTLCSLLMCNGFIVIGKSAPASPENFNAELGRKFAYEDAVRQVWPLMGYALRDRLAAA